MYSIYVNPKDTIIVLFSDFFFFFAGEIHLKIFNYFFKQDNPNGAKTILFETGIYKFMRINNEVETEP